MWRLFSRSLSLLLVFQNFPPYDMIHWDVAWSFVSEAYCTGRPGDSLGLGNGSGLVPCLFAIVGTMASHNNCASYCGESTIFKAA